MRVRRPYLIALAVVVGLVGGAQGVGVAADLVSDRRALRLAAVDQQLIGLRPPAGYSAAACDAGAALCLTSRRLPEQSVEAVARLLDAFSIDSAYRCSPSLPRTPHSCTVLANVDGVLVVAYLHARLVDRDGIAFEGSDVTISAVEGPYDPRRWFEMEDDFMRSM